MEDIAYWKSRHEEISPRYIKIGSDIWHIKYIHRFTWHKGFLFLDIEFYHYEICDHEKKIFENLVSLLKYQNIWDKYAVLEISANDIIKENLQHEDQ